MKNCLFKYFFWILVFIQLDVSAQMTPTYVVSIPMRDGKSLAADVYVPSACSSCPTILIQTPYNKNNFRNGLPLGFLQNLESSPYSWVVVDWRGFYGSFAATVASPNRGQDGYDVMEWIVAQSWSNDKIGTWGPSALGGAQYNTMKENHPNHTCAVPLVAHPQTHYEGYFYGGVLEKSRLAQLDALGYGLSTNVLANPYYSVSWAFSESSSWYPSSIKIPTLQIGGWYDHNIDKMMDWYQACLTSADATVRDQQWLLIGPWVHGGTGIANVGSAVQGELTYANAEYYSNIFALDFFEYYLLNQANGWETTPKISYYEMGKDVWNSSNNATIETTTYEDWLLSSGNILSPNTGNGSTSFTSNPKDPSPTLGGPTLSTGLDQGPYDQISLESRADVITFSSGDLIADVSVSGRIKLSAYVQCDQADADLAVRVTDVYPDGRNMLINDGIRRLRFRNGYTAANESFMSAGQVYAVEVEMPFVNYTWKTGHEIKIYLSGNNATRWDVNLQNGGTMYAAGDTNTAVIQVHHNASYPSKLQLPGTGITLSKSESQESSSFSISPNPVLSSLIISGSEKTTSFQIFDLNGKVQKEGMIADEPLIDVSEFKPGMYVIIALDSKGNKTTKRFVKQ